MASVPNDPFFASIRQQPVVTGAGPCDLPILYWGASMAMVIYRVDPEITRPFIDGPFEPWPVLGKALVMLCLFEYRDTTIGPYGEVGLGVLIKRTGTRPSLLGAVRDLRQVQAAGLFVINLPVTTDVARAAGRELWGYPKYVAPMETNFREDGFRFVLGGEFECTMARGPGLTLGGDPFVLYSVSPAGRVLRTIVEVDHRVKWGGARTVILKRLGDGPTSRTIAALGLDTLRPSLACQTNGMRSILPLGVDMGAAPGREQPAAQGAK